MEKNGGLTGRNVSPVGLPRKRLPLVILSLSAVLFVSVIVALMIGSVGPVGGSGSVRMSFGDFFNGIMGHGSDAFQGAIIDNRLPRVLLAMLIGCALSASGTVMQAMFRNPMADPYVIGISSGAALGAATAVFIPLAFFQSYYALPLLAFIGAVATVFGVYAIARGAGGRLRVETLLLSGIAVGSFLGAVTALMMYLSKKQFEFLFSWLLGGLSTTSWNAVFIVVVPVIAGIAVLQLYARDLNAMSLGEEPAMHLGIDVETFKKIMLVVVALLTGVAVAFSGIIGFVGLLIPHMARLVVGANHKILLPIATIAGGIFLIWADIVARTVISPAEIPLGIITALCGAPFFLYLLWKSRR
jgi:iron complex transport system permease protein